MSGSSLDGLDLAICSFGEQFSIDEATSIPFPEVLKEILRNPLSTTTQQFLLQEAQFSTWLAESINKFIKQQPHEVTLIVMHGHTVLHLPGKYVSKQMGNGGIVASITGIDVLCDLRIQDIALGGQGAPLASTVDLHLFNEYTVCLNLGGIANMSLRKNDDFLSWDICPCNQLLNEVASLLGKAYDDKGQLASQGKFNKTILQALNEMTYYKLPPPKSLDNNWIRDNILPLLKMNIAPTDMLRTLVEFISERIASDVNRSDVLSGSKMLITGGGAHNDFLVANIKEKLNESIEVVIPDRQLIDFKEALLMAYMGFRYLSGNSNIVSSATGASKDSIAGAYYRAHG